MMTLRQACAAAALSVFAVGHPAWAQSPPAATQLEWRMTTVVTQAQPPVFERRGVVMLKSGEPGTVFNKLSAPQPPKDGLWTMNNDLTLRFEDNSTLSLQFAVTTRTSPEGRVLPGEYRSQGQVVGGTGRYAGAKGSVEVKVISGMDRTQPGILGDSFAEAVVRLSPAN